METRGPKHKQSFFSPGAKSLKSDSAWGLHTGGLLSGGVDVSGASDGEIFLELFRVAHKIEINLSNARPKIKTDSQPLYLWQHHWQLEVALGSPTQGSIGIFFTVAQTSKPEWLFGMIQPPHFTDEVLFEA